AGLALQPADAVAAGDQALGNRFAEVLSPIGPNIVLMNVSIRRLMNDLGDPLDALDLIGDLFARPAHLNQDGGIGLQVLEPAMQPQPALGDNDDLRANRLD